MTKLKTALLITSALLMLAACGESFRAKQISSEGANGNPATVDPITQQPIIQGQVPASIYQSFATRYSTALTNTAGTQTLANGIKSFSVTKRLMSPSIDNVTLEANIALDCTNRVIVRGMVNVAALKVGQAIRIGSQNSFTVEVQCNDTSCNEMSAAIMTSNHLEDMVVLVGLRRNTSRSTTTRHEMEPIGVSGVTGYHAFNNLIDYSIACDPNGNNPNPVVIDPTGPATVPTSNFVIDPSGPFVPTNNGTTNNNGPLESFFTL